MATNIFNATYTDLFPDQAVNESEFNAAKSQLAPEDFSRWAALKGGKIDALTDKLARAEYMAQGADTSALVSPDGRTVGINLGGAIENALNRAVGGRRAKAARGEIEAANAERDSLRAEALGLATLEPERFAKIAALSGDKDLQAEAARQYSIGRDRIADDRYTDDRDYSRGRDTVADERYTAETKAEQLRHDIANAWKEREFAEGNRQFGERMALGREGNALEAEKLGLQIDAARREAAQGPKLTDGQRKDAGFADRAIEADRELEAMDGYAPSLVDKARGAASVFGNARSAEHQRFDAASRDWINAQLRRESGAAISDTEFENYRQYLPQPGDAPETLKLKAEQRARMSESIGRGIPGYQAPAPRGNAANATVTPGNTRMRFNVQTGELEAVAPSDRKAAR